VKLVARIIDLVEFNKFGFWSLFFIQSYDDKNQICIEYWNENIYVYVWFQEI